MKKLILFVALALVSMIVWGQEQPQDLPQDQTQVAAPAQSQEEAKAQELNLKRVHFPQAFIQAGKEYPAGDYWLILAVKDNQSMFSVQNAQKELLFEELAIVKTRKGGRTGSSFRINKSFTMGKEYFRVKVTTPGQWLMGYFLVKK